MNKAAYSWLALLVVVGLLPTYGPPNFRYSGSDPTRDVLNVGWPLSVVIVDFARRPHLVFGPIAYSWLVAWLPVTCFAIVFAIASRSDVRAD